MCLLVPCAIALFATVTAAPAAAQIATGRSGTSTTSYITSREELWRDVWAFGICFARNRPDDAAALLATGRGTAEEAGVYRRILKGDQSCLGTTTLLSVPPRMIRGAIAEGAYRRVARRDTPPAATMAEVAAGTGATLTDSARCFVSHHGADAHVLLFETGPGSKREAEAVRRMMPDYQACLREGLKVNMEPIDLRFAFAEALYHATSPAAAAGR